MTARPFRSIASVLIQRTIVLAVLCMVVVFLATKRRPPGSAGEAVEV